MMKQILNWFSKNNSEEAIETQLPYGILYRSSNGNISVIEYFNRNSDLEFIVEYKKQINDLKKKMAVCQKRMYEDKYFGEI